jgi:hypothetical protein
MLADGWFFFGISMPVFLCFTFSIMGPQYSASFRCCLHVCLAGANAVPDCLCSLPSSWFYAPQTPAIKTNMCMSSLLSHFCCLCWNMQSSAVFTFRISLWVSGSVTQVSPALQPCWIKLLRWSFRGARVIVLVCAGQCCVFQCIFALTSAHQPLGTLSCRVRAAAPIFVLVQAALHGDCLCRQLVCAAIVNLVVIVCFLVASARCFAKAWTTSWI